MEILKFCIYERYTIFSYLFIDADFSSPDPSKIFFRVHTIIFQWFNTNIRLII